MSGPIRICFLADTHLGFDLPGRPRVRRRRRGHDFQANYERALRRALDGRADLVVHGGDLFHRSRVPPSLAWQGLEPLVRVAERGVPVVLVPGNHERARIPHARFLRHPRVHVLDRPTVVHLEVRGIRIALAGFPFQRRIRRRFTALLRDTGWRPGRADVDLLCIHQCVEGATVGPADFTFTTSDDVIRSHDVPAGFDAVFSGHIHRHQVLTRDLGGRPLPMPVLYPGSVERTAVAEKDETKGYLVVEITVGADGETGSPGALPGDGPGSTDHRPRAMPSRPRLRWRFHPLPARPMLVRELDVEGLDAHTLDRELRGAIASAPADAVLRIRTSGTASEAARRVLAASRLRRIAPATMNVEVRGSVAAASRTRAARSDEGTRPQLGLGL